MSSMPCSFHSSCFNHLKIPGSRCYFAGSEDIMPRELVVVLLSYCMTIVIWISDIVNGGIMTYSVINVPHRNGKGLHKTLILLRSQFSCTSLYHSVRLNIDFIVQGEVPVQSMKTLGAV